MNKNYLVERWACLELSFVGKQFNNPFTDAAIVGKFNGKHEVVEVEGFV